LKGADEAVVAILTIEVRMLLAQLGVDLTGAQMSADG
jgi:hypothetical protein